MKVPKYQNVDGELIRIRVLVILMLATFALLTSALWRIQVVHGQRYTSNLEKQSVRRVRLPGARGRILDRNGHVLADNRPSFGIAIYLEELRKPGPWANTISAVESLIEDIAETIELPSSIDREAITMHIRRRLPLPLLAWRDIGDAGLARYSERMPQHAGVDVYTEPMRVYPEDSLLGHVLGYIGRADAPTDEEEPFDYYLPEMTGKSGIEKHLNGVLSGESGGRLVRVDASGYKFKDIGLREPKPGHDIVLTVDMRIQQLAEEALGGDAGSVVVVDPRNGDVIAMASSPGYDPNDFIPSIPSKLWKSLLDNEDSPLLNRAVAGEYAPGSTFKPVVAMAALENNLAKASTTFNCQGYYELGKAKFRCAHGTKHGVLNMRESLQHSCNVYYYNLGLQIGQEYIGHMASAMGLGRKTGVSIDYERAGLVPSDAWKRRRFDDAWRPGDTCNFSIGQGALTATPLQMAIVTAAIANGGKVYKPRLVKGIRDDSETDTRMIPSEVVNDMNWSKKNLDVIRGGMKDVVMSPRGTGRYGAVDGVVVAGKTGTAEYGRRDNRKHRAWFIAFAPYDEPRYAIAFVLDDAMSGGISAAPRVAKVLDGIFRNDVAQAGRG